MIRKTAVRLKELAGTHISTQGLQNFCCIESACTVSCINYYLQPHERFFSIFLAIYFVNYLLSEKSRICIY